MNLQALALTREKSNCSSSRGAWGRLFLLRRLLNISWILQLGICLAKIALGTGRGQSERATLRRKGKKGRRNLLLHVIVLWWWRKLRRVEKLGPFCFNLSFLDWLLDGSRWLFAGRQGSYQFHKRLDNWNRDNLCTFLWSWIKTCLNLLRTESQTTWLRRVWH